MDLAKLVSLLANEALYFACPNELSDPFEGYLPKPYLEPLSDVIQEYVNDMRRRTERIANAIPKAELQRLDEGFADMKVALQGAIRKTSLRFGVSCWHLSDHESEAMWKLYSASGQGIAIESTEQQLKAAIVPSENLTIGRVKYVDFHKDPIEKGHKHYLLFLKRKSFEHERELRAILPLPEAGKGTLVKCDLETLITRIHVSPFAPPYLKPIVEYLCAGKPRTLDKPVVQSTLLDEPDYGLEIDCLSDFGDR